MTFGDFSMSAMELNAKAGGNQEFPYESVEELVENTGTIYNQTMALGHLDFSKWDDKFEKDWEDVSLALVGLVVGGWCGALLVDPALLTAHGVLVVRLTVVGAGVLVVAGVLSLVGDITGDL